MGQITKEVDDFTGEITWSSPYNHKVRIIKSITNIDNFSHNTY